MTPQCWSRIVGGHPILFSRALGDAFGEARSDQIHVVGSEGKGVAFHMLS